MFSLDRIVLGVPDEAAAGDFYSAALAPNPTVYDHTIDLDARGLAWRHTATPPVSGFGGYIISYILSQPTEVRAVLEAAVAAGATMSQPAKKGFFGGFSAVFAAPDGSVWKLAAPTKKDTGPATDPPLPTEVGAIVAVAEPQRSKDFYSALGMTVDRDYGSKFVDFQLTTANLRFGLMPPRSLAKDVGMEPGGEGSSAVVFEHHTAGDDDVDTLLTAAESAGGKVTGVATQTSDGYSGQFTDPDGHAWRVIAT